MKVTLSKMKNLQGVNSGVDEDGDQISDLEHKEGIAIQLEQSEETRIQKKWEAEELLGQL